MLISDYAVKQTTWCPEPPLAQDTLTYQWRSDYQSFYHPDAPSGMRVAPDVILTCSKPLLPRIENREAVALNRFDWPVKNNFWHGRAEGGGNSHLYGPVSVVYNGVSVELDDRQTGPGILQSSPVTVQRVGGMQEAGNHKPAGRIRGRRKMKSYLGAVAVTAGARFSAQVRHNPRTRWWEAR